MDANIIFGVVLLFIDDGIQSSRSPSVCRVVFMADGPASALPEVPIGGILRFL